MFKSHLVPQPQQVFTLENFGVTDSKGRQIGCFYTIGQCEFVEFDPEAHRNYGYRDIEPGKYFFTNASSARDGKSYGPCQQSKYFKTMAEAQNEIAKYLASAKARAIQKAGSK